MPTCRVLIVDDNPAFLGIVEDLLLAEGDRFEVIGRASSGRQAIALVDRLRPDLVLMDLSMPDIDGLEATRLIVERADPPLAVIMTARDEPEYREAAKKAGAAGFLLKDELDVELIPLVDRLPLP